MLAYVLADLSYLLGERQGIGHRRQKTRVVEMPSFFVLMRKIFYAFKVYKT